MNVDLKNSTKVVQLVGPISQTSNTAVFGMDLNGYVGEVAVTVAFGTKTVGDANGAITVQVQTSATNNVSNATNYVPTSGGTNVATSNNASAIGDISVDTRNALRYLFISPTVTGTNSPAYPMAVIARGVLKYQPGI